jgi:hypothetical protein
MVGIASQYTPVQPYVSSSQLFSDALRARTDEIRAQMDAYRKKQDEASAVIAQLPQKMNDEQKAAAAQKVQRIKDQLKMLMMMSGIGDPRANARQLAQLGKELAAAAHEYASAGGSDNAAANASSGTSVATPIASASNQNGASPVVADSDASAQADAAKAVGTVVESSTNSAAGIVQDESQQQMKSSLQSMASGLQHKSDLSSADQEFIKEIRSVANLLKSLVRQQEARLSQTGDKTGEIPRMYQALADIDKNVSAIGAPDVALPVSINLFA